MSVVDCKWLFKLKNYGKSVRYKARLVPKGFTYKEGIDYTAIFILLLNSPRFELCLH